LTSLPCSASTVRNRKEVQLQFIRSRHGLSNEPSTKALRRPNFLKMGIKYLNCRLSDNFHNKGREVWCKISLYKSCQRQSCSAINCLSNGINILAGGSSLPLISKRQRTDPIGSTWRRAVLSADAGLLVEICERTGRQSDRVTRSPHPDSSSKPRRKQLSFLPPAGREMNTSQSAVTLCGWRVKAGMVHSTCG